MLISLKNPIVEIYRGVPIREYPIVKFRISKTDAKKLVDAKKDFGLSAIEAIQQMKALCNICNQQNFIKAKNM